MSVLPHPVQENTFQPIIAWGQYNCWLDGDKLVHSGPFSSGTPDSTTPQSPKKGLFRAAPPTAYGGFQARGRIGAVAASLRHGHSNAIFLNHWVSHSNTRSLTHWVRPGIESASSWIFVRFVSTEPQRELPKKGHFKLWKIPLNCSTPILIFVVFLNLVYASILEEVLWALLGLRKKCLESVSLARKILEDKMRWIC